MANPVLVDSCYYIDRQRSQLDPFAGSAAADEAWEPITCGMVMLEVLRGMRAPRAIAAYRATFAVMACVPTTNRIWDAATNLVRSLEGRGIVIPVQDAIIAASALSVGAAVLTFDDHFQRVPGLTVLNQLL